MEHLRSEVQATAARLGVVEGESCATEARLHETERLALRHGSEAVLLQERAGELAAEHQVALARLLALKEEQEREGEGEWEGEEQGAVQPSWPDALAMQWQEEGGDAMESAGTPGLLQWGAFEARGGGDSSAMGPACATGGTLARPMPPGDSWGEQWATEACCASNGRSGTAEVGGVAELPAATGGDAELALVSICGHSSSGERSSDGEEEQVWADGARVTVSGAAVLWHHHRLQASCLTALRAVAQGRRGRRMVADRLHVLCLLSPVLAAWREGARLTAEVVGAAAAASQRRWAAVCLRAWAGAVERERLLEEGRMVVMAARRR